MSDLVEQMRGAVRHWWTSLVIGLLAVILGVWCFITPMSTLGALTMLFIVAFFASGIFEVVFAVANRHMHGAGLSAAVSSTCCWALCLPQAPLPSLRPC